MSEEHLTVANSHVLWHQVSGPRIIASILPTHASYARLQAQDADLQKRVIILLIPRIISGVLSIFLVSYSRGKHGAADYAELFISRVH